jgi:N-acetylmuramoyl-L-alanine amidase
MNWLFRLIDAIRSYFFSDKTDKDFEEDPPSNPINNEIPKNEPMKTNYDFSDLKPLDLSDQDLVQVPWLRYYKVEWPKKQIVLHHTVSGPGIDGDLSTWEKFTSHIATCMIVERPGKINQLFSSRYWGYHLGVGKASLDQASIAIELDSWGGLFLGDGNNKQFGKKDDGTPKIIKTIQGKFYTVYGSVVDVPVTYYPNGFRGYYYYEAYSYEQLRAAGELLLLWNKTYGIPLTYNADMWDVSQKALNGDSGVWTHVSYRKPSDKQDCHPDENLISLLKYLGSL